MADKRQYVFIGSLSEGLDITKTIQANLNYCCEIRIWSQGGLGLGEVPMASSFVVTIEV